MFRSLRPAGDRIRFRSRLERWGGVTELAGRKRVTFLQSGTAALAAAVSRAVEGRGGRAAEVVVPAYGCPDLVSAVVHAGARARLVDLEAERPWMDPAALAEALSANPAAVIAVNFLGIPERLERLRPMLAAHDTPLIYDCAQSFADGMAAEVETVVLSFGRGKPVTLLDGGAVLEQGDGARALRGPYTGRPTAGKFMSTARFLLRAVTYNVLAGPRLYWLPAALPWLALGATRYRPLREIAPAPRHLERYLIANVAHHQARPLLAQQRLREALGELPNDCFLDLPAACGVAPDWPLLRYPVLCGTPALRDRAVARLNAAGLGASAFYGATLDGVEGVPRERLLGTEAPHARAFAARLMTLPVHEDVGAGDVERMGELLGAMG